MLILGVTSPPRNPSVAHSGRFSAVTRYSPAQPRRQTPPSMKHVHFKTKRETCHALLLRCTSDATSIVQPTGIYRDFVKCASSYSTRSASKLSTRYPPLLISTPLHAIYIVHTTAKLSAKLPRRAAVSDADIAALCNLQQTPTSTSSRI